jgi:hypothetical protein
MGEGIIRICGIRRIGRFDDQTNRPQYLLLFSQNNLFGHRRMSSSQKAI